MEEDVPGFSTKPDFGQPSPLQQGQIYSLPKADPAVGTIFSRFVQKVGQIFNTAQPVPDMKLAGRIQELQSMGDGVLAELLEFKKDIERQVDPELFALIVTILDPLIKEAGRFPLADEDRTAQQVKMFSRYVDSIERGKTWVEIGKNTDCTEKLEKALIQQTAKEFLYRIDRDIQVIQDYLSHTLGSFEMSDSLKNELKDKLMPGLSLKLQELHQLKTHPPDISLNSFIRWRSHSDQARESIFGVALHIIDEFANEFLPSPAKEKESDHLEAITILMTELEKNVNKIDRVLKSTRHMNENQCKALISELERLEIDAHQLNANLYLSAEQSERVEAFLETLLAMRHDLTGQNI